MGTIRVPLSEAVTRLGVSERTLRRRLAAGTLAGVQVATPQGYRWYVDVDEAPAGDAQAVVTRTPDATALLALLARLDRLETKLDLLLARGEQPAVAQTRPGLLPRLRRLFWA